MKNGVQILWMLLQSAKHLRFLVWWENILTHDGSTNHWRTNNSMWFDSRISPYFFQRHVKAPTNLERKISQEYSSDISCIRWESGKETLRPQTLRNWKRWTHQKSVLGDSMQRKCWRTKIMNICIFPIPLRYIDVTKATRTILDVMLKSRIDDYWNAEGDRDLSDSWTGFTRFTIMNEKAPDGCTWSGGRQMQSYEKSNRSGLSKNRSSTIQVFTSLIQQMQSSRKLQKILGASGKVRCQQLCLARSMGRKYCETCSILLFARQNMYASLKPTNLRESV